MIHNLRENIDNKEIEKYYIVENIGRKFN